MQHEHDTWDPQDEKYVPHHADLKFTNYAPHDIVVCDDTGKELITFPASGKVARVSTRTDERQGFLMEGFRIPLVILDYGPVEGLDDWDGVSPIIVSAMAAEALAKEGRTSNVYYPDTGPDSAIRDEAGQIRGVRRLAYIQT